MNLKSISVKFKKGNLNKGRWSSKKRTLTKSTLHKILKTKGYSTMMLIQENASSAFKESGVMGLLITNVVNTCRQYDECDLLLSGEKVSAEDSVRKMFGILVGFRTKPRKEHWECSNGHPPLTDQHFYHIKRDEIGRGREYDSPEKMLFVCKETLESPDAFGKVFQDICAVFQPSQGDPDSFCFSISTCELLIEGKKKHAKKMVQKFNALSNALSHKSRHVLLASLIPSVIESEEFNFAKVSRIEKR